MQLHFVESIEGDGIEVDDHQLACLVKESADPCPFEYVFRVEHRGSRRVIDAEQATNLESIAATAWLFGFLKGIDVESRPAELELSAVKFNRLAKRLAESRQ